MQYLREAGRLRKAAEERNIYYIILYYIILCYIILIILSAEWHRSASMGLVEKLYTIHHILQIFWLNVNVSLHITVPYHDVIPTICPGDQEQIISIVVIYVQSIIINTSRCVTI